VLPVVIAVIIAAVVLVVFGRMASRRGRELREQQKREFATGEKTSAEPVEPVDVSGLRPTLVDFHVHDTDAIVTFAVPLPEGDIDEVLVDILVNEAVEVTREKSHTLPIDQVTRVVAKSGDRRVGVRELEKAGLLPRSVGTTHLPQLHTIGADPVDRQFDGDRSAETPVSHGRGDALAPIGTELKIPKAIDVGLRSQGVDPATMNAGELVQTVLTLFGHSMTPGDRPDSYMSSRSGHTTYLVLVPHGDDDHPELGEKEIEDFMFGFRSSKADRGLLVTDKFAPFEIYERERREPRVRFLSRERLQKFIDGAALG
jgi:hypothetical protein